jgi:hypothetical protein
MISGWSSVWSSVSCSSNTARRFRESAVASTLSNDRRRGIVKAVLLPHGFLVRTSNRPEGFSLAGQQKVHHALRIEATGINPESDVR